MVVDDITFHMNTKSWQVWPDAISRDHTMAMVCEVWQLNTRLLDNFYVDWTTRYMSQVTCYFHRIPQLAVTELVNVCKIFSRACVPDSWKRMVEHFPQKTEADSCGKHIAQTLSKVCWQQREASHGFPFSTAVGKMAPKLSPLPRGQGYNQSLSSAPTTTHQKAWDVHRVTAMYYGLLETATDPSSWAWLLVAHNRKSGSHPPKLSLGLWMNGIHCEKMLNFYAHAPAHTHSRDTHILRHARIHISGRSNLLVLTDTQRENRQYSTCMRVYSQSV